MLEAKGHKVPDDVLKRFGLYKESKELRAFTNGYETVIAKNPEDASLCLIEHIGYEDEDMKEMNPWEEIDDTKYLEIRQDELNWHLNKQTEIPMPKNYSVLIRARVDEWIAVCGRTVLCSTEW